MDGNNRWSKKNSISKFLSYKKGSEKLLNLTNFLFDNTEAQFVSSFALSKNNLFRSKSTLNVIKKVLSETLDQIENHNISFDINFIGNFHFLDFKLQKKIKLINSNSKFKKKLFIFLNYGGRDDIESASLKTKNKNGLKKNLMTKDVPDPDLLIRTGGFSRISDFMLYQIAFTDLFFINKYWPDFKINDLKKIILRFRDIERKFGK